MALTVSEVLSKLVGREDVQASISTILSSESAVLKMIEAAGNPVRKMQTPVLAYASLDTPTFATWDNSGAKTSQALAGDVGEAVSFTTYAIIAYPKNFDVDIASFPETFSRNIAAGFAKYVDYTILNATSTGIIPLCSGVSNDYPTTVTGATSYQLYSDLVATGRIVLAGGLRVNGIIGELEEEASIYGALSTTGAPVFSPNQDGSIARVLGKTYASTDAAMANSARFVVGDWSKLVVGTYGPMEMRTFDQGSVNIGGTEYNLIERNMVAVRAEQRMAFKVTRTAAFAYLYDA